MTKTAIRKARTEALAHLGLTALDVTGEPSARRDANRAALKAELGRMGYLPGSPVFTGSVTENPIIIHHPADDDPFAVFDVRPGF